MPWTHCHCHSIIREELYIAPRSNRGVEVAVRYPTGSTRILGPFRIAPLKDRAHDWAVPMMEAMKQGADSVFILSCRWGHQVYAEAEAEQWNESKMARWNEMVAKAKAKHKEENDKRRAAGQPPRVINHGDRGVVRAYFPGEPLLPQPKWVWYTPREMTEAFENMRKEHLKGRVVEKSGLPQRNKDSFVINVVHFTRESGDGKEDRFMQLARLTKGDYSQVKGMKAIQSYVSAGE